MKQYKQLFSQFLESPHKHFAAHSHHYWPDVSLKATTDYWQLSKEKVDHKWGEIFGPQLKELRQLISNKLGFQNSDQLVFAPSTHELVYRVLSCYYGKKIKILTTDSEFYSFKRQAYRLQEVGAVDLIEVPLEPFDNFEERFLQTAEQESHDFVFFSHVFFNSGYVADLEPILNELTKHSAPIFVDGYHGFMAVPFDFSKYEDKVFYTAGAYKYAASGEGCCFMYVPSNFTLNPVYTGWFAGFNELSSEFTEVHFPNDAQRFMGSTMDYTPMFRLKAYLSELEEKSISLSEIQQYINSLKEFFVENLPRSKYPFLNEDTLLLPPGLCGQFLSFKMATEELCKGAHEQLSSDGIMTDYRGCVLRIGFGIYHDQKDLETFFKS